MAVRRHHVHGRALDLHDFRINQAAEPRRAAMVALAGAASRTTTIQKLKDVKLNVIDPAGRPD